MSIWWGVEIVGLTVFVNVILTLTFIICQKDSDEGRPYEFGFTIEGQQHRHEKKDENGIIQGEFGFITADGIYHVTVYATDENGNFKILSMKNIRISAPLDGSPATGPISPEASKYLKTPNKPDQPKSQQPQQFQRLEQLPNPPPPVIAATPKPQLVFTTKPTVKPACAGCGYVTTSRTTTSIPQIGINVQQATPPNLAGGVFPQSNGVSPDIPNGVPPLYPSSFSPQYPTGGSPESPTVSIQSQPPPDVEILPPYYQSDMVGPSAGSQAIQVPAVNDYQQTNNQIMDPGNQPGKAYEERRNQYVQPPSSVRDQQSGSLFAPGRQNQVPGIPIDHLASLGNQTNQREYVEILDSLPNRGVIPNLAGPSGQLKIPPASTETSKLPPISVSDNSIHVGGKNPQDIPIQDKFPGMTNGLPDGIEERDVTDLLYKFKYTVGFHGHYEKGLKDGTKIGGYFVNGRDGFSRVVTYVADENGYRPKFKLINLGLDSPDTPKEDTEKTFGLKSFEFVWYPIE